MIKSNDLVQSIVELRESDAIEIVRSRLENGQEPFDIMNEAREALMIIGKRFENGEYFIPELIFSGEIMKGISALTKPFLTIGTNSRTVGKVVIGTVAGDIHDIGKDMVSFMLEINGFTVHDLGVDVPIDRFVECVKETKSQIVGLSAFLTNCIVSMKATIEAFQKAGLRDQVKIMIGGNFVSDLICREVGADDWGGDAGAAVRIARKWININGE